MHRLTRENIEYTCHVINDKRSNIYIALRVCPSPGSNEVPSIKNEEDDSRDVAKKGDLIKYQIYFGATPSWDLGIKILYSIRAEIGSL